MKEDLRGLVSVTLWQSHLEGTKGRRLEGDTLIVRVKARASIDTLENARLKREIENILRGVTGRTIGVRYTQEQEDQA